MLQPSTWPQIASRLAAEIGQNEYATWFSGSTLLASDDSSVTIGLPNAFVLTAAQRKHGDQVAHTVAEILGRPVKINFKTAAADSPPVGRDPAALTQPVSDKPQLRPQFSFDDFLVGPENQLANATARAIADGQSTFNPLFLHGPCGVGKTHLLRAIAASDRQGGPAIYSTMEQFTNQLVLSLRKNSPESLRNRYRSAQLVLFDDVYFVAGKKATQEELFHTIDCVAGNGGTVVLASDRCPSEMAELPDRLRSRFASGIVVDIQPPGFELRLAFIERRSQLGQIRFPAEAQAALAAANIPDFRKLAGLINRLLAQARLDSRQIDLNQVVSLLARYDQDGQSTRICPETIINQVASRMGVDSQLITGTSRKQQVVAARNLCAYLIRHLTNAPLTAVGESLGGRSHSTVLNALSRAQIALQNDPRLRVIAEQIGINPQAR